ncbi:bifunctional protein-serine/threonine kinase/phosphatase [Denitratisoma oestradiolicum]|uniref:Putative serine/threonine protein kinase n=1 Tax=Denitratisoma oestradiolicum TaxID=311182 RepID=A0A6S6Y624_9PROT|nr:bifunctional protein-serine/threonine kinase/phosphatase [Denitratisoma oestradiolicum]TWO79576.1 serine/threonine protein phosphatase [Denitratisoma oestradiolicum]CAB1368028.1 putative serine/threonine protein kinase [Denitratisoma oestradiolicum]
MPSSLSIDVGYSSLTGPRPRNEDFVGFVTPEDGSLETKGMLLALADGVGGSAAGGEAAEYTVRGLLADYYATPDTWAVPKALDTVLLAINRWLLSHAAARREAAGMATTLSALVLRGSRWYSCHVGDSRIYRLRGGQLECLTQDHVWDHPELRHVLTRAVGLDAHLVMDYGEGELAVGDVFALMSDGVWNTLGVARIGELLGRHVQSQDAAADLAGSALQRGAQDNCSALVLRVLTVPDANLRDRLTGAQQWPLPPRLKPGQTLDGLTVEELLHESRVTLLYRVRREVSGESLVLKTLLPEAADAEARNALIHEEWLARRATSRYFPQVADHPPRAHLYYLMSWHEGETLRTMLERGHRFSLVEATEIGIHLLQGLAALHRLGIVHRDIKPDNIHLGRDGRLRILDLGVAASDGVDLQEINNPGTPSYMAPELFQGQGATVASDLYAAGATLYQLLTRKYPYGEVEPFQTPRFGDPATPLRYRADIPAWLESVLLKAVARDLPDRFETAEEFLLALEQGAHKPLRMHRRMPLVQRDPHFPLKLLAALSLVLNFFLLWLLFLR